jgi:hypothetical protein
VVERAEREAPEKIGTAVSALWSDWTCVRSDDVQSLPIHCDASTLHAAARGSANWERSRAAEVVTNVCDAQSSPYTNISAASGLARLIRNYGANRLPKIISSVHDGIAASRKGARLIQRQP